MNFWTLTCINWLRQVPYVRAWSQAYRDDGLVVIGVHTPEFSFEHDLELVRHAVEDRAIDYPVAADNDYDVWNAFDNHYWPALYFIDTDGIIRDQHFGEGSYEHSERTLQRLLGISRDLVDGPRVRSRGGGRLGTPAHSRDLPRPRPQPELRVSQRGARPRQDVRAARRACPSTTGPWTVRGRSGASGPSSTRRVGRIAFRFHARDAHLVLASRTREPIAFRVLLDGRTARPLARCRRRRRREPACCDDGRMYQLVREHDTVRERTLQITFLEPGVEAYAFTFG